MKLRLGSNLQVVTAICLVRTNFQIECYFFMVRLLKNKASLKYQLNLIMQCIE